GAVRAPCAPGAASSTSSACGFLRFPSLGPEAPGRSPDQAPTRANADSTIDGTVGVLELRGWRWGGKKNRAVPRIRAALRGPDSHSGLEWRGRIGFALLLWRSSGAPSDIVCEPYRWH